MGYMSEREFDRQMREIRRQNENFLRRDLLKKEKKKYKKQNKIPTSKKVLFFTFLICLEIIIFTEYAMIRLGDVSALYSLIGIPVTLVPIVLGYMNKSKIENSAGGIVYDMTMANLNMPSQEETINEEEAKG